MERAIENYVNQLLAAYALPGLAVGVVKGGQTIYTQGFGVRDIETRAPVTERSLFHLASISKTFVASGVVQLAVRGLVDLDAPVHRYLPYFRLADPRCQEITLRQMLSHTSGTPDTGEYHWDQPEYDDAALERYVRSLADLAMIGAPSEKFSYSNIAYEVLGDVIAKVSGQTFESFMRTNLLQPLGMHSSTFLKTEVPYKLSTTPHLNLPLPSISAVYPYNRAHAPSSTLHSSAVEMCYWAEANLQRGQRMGQRVLPASSYEELWRKHSRAWEDAEDIYVGLSWFLTEYRGQRQVSHGGGDVGYNSYLTLLPEAGIAVVLLANTVPAPLWTAAPAILDILLGEEPPRPKQPVLIALWDILSSQGVEAALAQYRAWEKSRADELDWHPNFFVSVGFSMIELNREPSAIQVLQLCAHVQPKLDEPLALLAWAYQRRGDRVQAQQKAQACLVLNPKNDQALRIMKESGPA